MQMPTTIVPDHGHVFNANFVGLLDSFFPDQTEMEDPRKFPVLMSK
jgi:hypothetical protein